MCNPISPSSVLACGEPREVDCGFVIPVYNEEAELGSSVMLLMEQLRQISLHASPFTWQIVIADNASSDKTWDLCRVLAGKFPFTVRTLRIPQKGRGRALKIAWTSSRARVRAYMDVDLSTDIRQIPELVGPILDGRADVSFGSRLLTASHVERRLKREVISRTYTRMLQGYLSVDFRDAQCGFKAISAEAAEMLLPKIEDNEWFFDTKLLVLAERLDIATNEFAVRWREDAGSTVHTIDTVKKDLAGMRKLKQGMRAGTLGLPGFALAMLAFSPTRWPRRFLDAAIALGTMCLAAGWWIALTVVVPSGSRPYFGGSQSDSFIELTFGYNGLGRLTGNETGSVVPGGEATAAGVSQGGIWGVTGLLLAGVTAWDMALILRSSSYPVLGVCVGVAGVGAGLVICALGYFGSNAGSSAAEDIG